jgi:ABC-type sugar transport system substrate-binding protein
MLKRLATTLAVAATALALTAATAQKKLVVGFAQVGAESAWRTANTKSMKDEAAKRGIELKFVDAQGKQENQIQAINSFITQKVDAIILAPVVETGFEPVLRKAKAAGIPVILSDRRAKVSSDDLYVTFIGADFVEEGRRAAKYVIEKTGGKANIAELTGTPGAAPANDRKKGFAEGIKDHADMKVIMSQTGNFERAGGKQVMEAFLKSAEGKNINVLYAHNDDMALGAIQAIEAAGLKPGKDILVVSIDGVKAAFEAMVEGKLNCTVECNPMIGAQVFDAIEAIKAGKTLPKRIDVQEGVFTQEQAKEALPTRQY